MSVLGFASVIGRFEQFIMLFRKRLSLNVGKSPTMIFRLAGGRVPAISRAECGQKFGVFQGFRTPRQG
jgi:hypothetical protein